MDIILETERLLLRKFTSRDAALLYELNKDPEVIRYTLDPMTDPGQAEQVLLDVILPQYQLYNYGRWAVHLKSNLEFLGWCGLKYLSERDEIDIGYRYMKRFWGQGIDTEAAKAVLDYGFSTLKLDRIVGRSLPGNIASIKVLEKCGMEYVGQHIVENLVHETYELKNPAYPVN